MSLITQRASGGLLGRCCGSSVDSVLFVYQLTPSDDNPQALTNNPHYIKWSLALGRPVYRLLQDLLSVYNEVVWYAS